MLFSSNITKYIFHFNCNQLPYIILKNRRLWAGPLFEEILNRMDYTAKNVSDPKDSKLFGYVGHDITGKRGINKVPNLNSRHFSGWNFVNLWCYSRTFPRIRFDGHSRASSEDGCLRRWKRHWQLLRSGKSRSKINNSNVHFSCSIKKRRIAKIYGSTTLKGAEIHAFWTNYDSPEHIWYPVITGKMVSENILIINVHVVIFFSDFGRNFFC